jgi:hypothetical protein
MRRRSFEVLSFGHVVLLMKLECYLFVKVIGEQIRHPSTSSSVYSREYLVKLFIGFREEELCLQSSITPLEISYYELRSLPFISEIFMHTHQGAVIVVTVFSN